MGDLRQDLRYALASLRAGPSFALAVVATLALGLGTTTAVASVVYTVLLAPAPYADPDGIVQIGRAADGRSTVMLPPADVRALEEGASDFMTVAAGRFRDVALGGSGPPERVRAVVVTGATLGMLGIQPLLGRLPGEAEDTPGGPCVVALSHEIWVERFGARPDVIGDAVRLDGDPCTVIAVMPPGFAFPAPYWAPGQFWVPTGPAGVDWSADDGRGFLVFGRLAPGVDVAGARTRLDVLSARGDDRVRFTAMRWGAPSRESSRQRLLVLLAAAALVLVIAVVNVAMLQLARYVDRRGEIATRLALGASQGRLVRMVAVETAVLTTGGALAGLVVAGASTEGIVALRSFFIPRMEEVAVDGFSVALCLSLSLVVGLVTAWIPALGLSDTGGSVVLRRVGRGLTPGARGRRFGRGLVAVETALAFVLLAGAVLLFRSYHDLASVDPGFRTGDVLHGRVTPPAERYPDKESLAAFYRDVEERVAALPGVLDVGLTDVPPGVGAGPGQSFALAGRDPTPGSWSRTVWRTVSEGYRSAVDIPLVRGRSLAQARGVPRAAVVNQTFVLRFFPEGDDPIGARLHRVDSPRADAPRPEAWTIVGVVADAREHQPYSPAPPAAYTRFTDTPPRSMAILARTAGEPMALAGELREAVASVDPIQPVFIVRDLEFIVDSQLDLNRLGMTLLGLFAGAALLLAVVGIYGVIAHIVGRRMREMAIRIAVGARGADVLRLVVGDCAVYAVAGAVLGLGLLMAVGDRLGSLTPGWTGLDAGVLAVTAVVVTGVAVLAAYAPSRRVASADPVTALRRE